MQGSFQAYIKILKSFYQKTIKQHQKVDQLTRSLNAVISQIQSKNDLDYRTTRLQRKKSDLSVSQRSHSRKPKHASKRCQKKHINQKYQSLMNHQNFGTILAFAYIHLIVNKQNREVFRMIQTKSKLLYFNQQMQKQNDKIKWEHNLMEWKKISFMFENKNTVKWQKILINAFQSFSNKFNQIILRSILNLNVNSKIQLEPTPGTFQNISNILKISIHYYKIEQEQIKQCAKIGSYPNSIIIGQKINSNQKNYACFDKLLQQLPQEQDISKIPSLNLMPLYSQRQIKPKSDTNLTEQSSQRMIKTKSQRGIQNMSEVGTIKTQNYIQITKKSNGNQKLARKKCILTIQFLLKQFRNDTNKLSDLECFNSQQEDKFVEIARRKSRGTQPRFNVISKP